MNDEHTTIQDGFKYHEWFETSLKMSSSDFGKEVLNILGYVYGGLYHLHGNSLTHKRTNWNDTRQISIVASTSLATWDTRNLTTLVLLCHRYCIRLGIDAVAPTYLRLTFTKRDRTQNSGEYPISRGHPTIEQALADFNKAMENKK